MHRIAMLCATAALLVTGCGQRPPPVAAPAPAAPAATQAGIAWFAGSIEQAFAAAAAQHKLVFLYWGAGWCPPCHDLQAQVFSRRDFQEKLRQFIPVHLDGDAPGAQRAGEQFQVLGYPTVLVLTAERRELARIAGGGDLGSYAEILDLALDSVRPLPEVLAGLRVGAGALSEADCRRLAWNGWDVDPREQPAQLGAALQLAAARCPAGAVPERDRLVLTAANLVASAQRAAIQAGRPPDARLAGLLDAVAALLADHQRALRAGDAVLALDDDYFFVARRVRPASVAALRANWFALMDDIEHDTRYGDSTRLESAAKRLLAARMLDPQGRIPAAVTARARATLAAFLARDYDPDTRAGVVNSAEWVLTYLDDKVALRALLEHEIASSKTPYYYMADLADLDEQQGDKAQALALLQRAYAQSSGPATRFQWGALYVAGLLRMSPADEPRIRAAAIQVLGELDGPDRIHARARARLDKLDAALGRWAAQTGHAGTLQFIGRRWRQICAALPASDPVRPECPRLVASSS